MNKIAELYNSINSQRYKGVGTATAVWQSTQEELEALENHRHIQKLRRVDQIWPWLKENYGEVLAVDAPYVRHPESYTYEQLAELITTASFAFEKFGVREKDVVALFAENSPRWLIADQGIMRVGAANAVRGASAPVEELRYILNHSESVALVVQTAELWKNLSLTPGQKKDLRLVLQLEGRPEDDQVIGWDEFLASGLESQAARVESRRQHDLDASAIATILYTSGTTGQPKGVPLTHTNLLHQMRSLACVANPPAGSAVLSVLPIWHAYERSAEYYFFSCACSQSYTNIKQLKNDLPRVRPVVMATVPRLWEAIQNGFEDVVANMSPIGRFVLTSSLSNSRSYKLAIRTFRNLLIANTSTPFRFIALSEVVVRWPMHFLSAFLLWPKVVKKLSGGKLLFPINGGGALAPHVDLFFEALGIELLVGYGLTETSPVLSCRRPWRNIRGSSGQPLPDTEFRIIDPETRLPKMFFERGKVLARGPQVMSGYFRNPDATSKVLDDQGWFDTGDLGMIIPDGSLVLTGRSKDTIVLSNGENIEPGPLEQRLVASDLLEQVMLVGQDERQLGVLVVPKVDSILVWADEKGIVIPKDLGGSPGDEKVRMILRREINMLLSTREGSRPDERVAGVALVEPFTIENGLLTQTLKQKREQILARDAMAVESIFRS